MLILTVGLGQRAETVANEQWPQSTRSCAETVRARLQYYVSTDDDIYLYVGV